jgi:hypothetical protein
VSGGPQAGVPGAGQPTRRRHSVGFDPLGGLASRTVIAEPSGVLPIERLMGLVRVRCRERSDLPVESHAIRPAWFTDRASILHLACEPVRARDPCGRPGLPSDRGVVVVAGAHLFAARAAPRHRVVEASMTRPGDHRVRAGRAHLHRPRALTEGRSVSWTATWPQPRCGQPAWRGRARRPPHAGPRLHREPRFVRAGRCRR